MLNMFRLWEAISFYSFTLLLYILYFIVLILSATYKIQNLFDKDYKLRDIYFDIFEPKLILA